MVEQARCPTRLSSTGLEVHEPLAQSGLGVGIHCALDVLKLERVSGQVVDLHEDLKGEEGPGER